MITPTSMVAGGDAIGRADDGRVVFITGALPGEEVDIEIVDRRRDFLRARVIDVVRPSPLRVAPPCPELARGCGGCQWQHITIDGQRALKTEIIREALERQGVAAVAMRPTVGLADTAYRTAVRAAVVGERAGYHHTRSHDVTTIESCMVAHPLIEDLLVNGRYPGAREVILRCGARTGERLAAPTPADAPIAVPDDAKRAVVHEIVAGRHWQISPRSFFQARVDGADALTALILEAAEGRTGHAVDLYSGVGLFAGLLADNGWRVTAVEGSAAAAADAQMNLAGDACTVVRADVAKWTPAGADFVVADPSRDGLRRAGVDVVVATGAARVVLVSCDPASLGRDARLLVEAGYAVTSVTPVDMFPHTFHVEVVTIFDRASASA